MGTNNNITQFFIRLLFDVVRWILSLRYKVKITGIEHLKGNTPKLIMPNHQAIIDPVLLMGQIYRYSKVVPVLTSSYYDMPGLHFLFKKWGALRVSDLEAGSRNINVLDDILKAVKTGLSKDKNIAIYPSGQIASQGKEVIKNKKSAYRIVTELPANTEIIGIRISGLWGSMWSKARTGESPNLLHIIFKGFFITLSNLIFLMPRRKIYFEIENITSEARNASKKDQKYFNKFLEKFYNKHGEEKANFLSHFFFCCKKHPPSFTK